MPTCDDLRLGGTLTASGITGGLSINNTAISVRDWSGVLGNPGVSLSPFNVSGRPGSMLVGDGLPRQRFLTLNMQIDRFGPVNYALTEPTEPEQLVENTDDFLTLLASPTGQYLEVTLPDTSVRFLHVVATNAASVNQPKKVRTMSVPLTADTWYWRAGGNQSTDTISGADTLTTAGRVTVYDPVLVFAGNGAFTNTTAGWTMTITGAVHAVTVDVGARTVTQAGIPADQLLTVTDRGWGWFNAGANSVTASTSTVVTWRDAFN